MISIAGAKKIENDQNFLPHPTISSRSLGTLAALFRLFD